MEKLKIKNFYPVVEADIEIKPLTLFVGESASGKSVILKLLSLFRWIHKRTHLKELTRRLVTTSSRFRIEKMLRDSGLEDFCVRGSFAQYTTDNFSASIICNGKPRLKIEIPNKKIASFTLEKIAFVADDRFSIPLLLNNQFRVTTLPYHLDKTFEDFIAAFESLNTDNKVKIQTFGVELAEEKIGIQKRFVIKNKGGAKTQLHNASSGMKSVSIIELISAYFAKDSEYIQRGLNNYLISLFNKSDYKDAATFLNKIKKVEFNKDRFSLFIEEPELSLYPDSQKTLIKHLVRLCFDQKEKHIQLAFSTHSPYILSILNVLLLAHQIGTSATLNDDQRESVRQIVPENLWLNVQQFNAFKIKDGIVESLISEHNLILAEEIDGVSEQIEDDFEKLFEIQNP